MAVPTNTLVTADNVGAREDLTNIISRVAPEKTPFLTMLGKGVKATNNLHEWQTDDLDPPDGNNKHVGGDDTAADPANLTQRLGNYCQIMKKSPRVSDEIASDDLAGRKSEMKRQMRIKSMSLKRDQEVRLTGNNSKVAPTGSVAGELAGFEAWMKSNVNRGTGGASNAAGVAAKDGTKRDYAEALLTDVVDKCIISGANPTTIMLGAKNRTKMSGFAGRAQTVINGKGTQTVHATVSFYETSNGTLKAVTNIHMRKRSVFIIDPDYWAIAYKRKYNVKDLAKTGDSTQKQLLTQFTLQAKNEKSSGIIADLNDG